MAFFHSNSLLWLKRVFLSLLVLNIIIGEWGGVLAEILVKDLNSNDTAAIFPDMQASFGDDFPKHGLEGRVIFADPKTACRALAPAPTQVDNYAWIVLIARGGCTFSEKVLNAQRANFCTAIVYNYKGKQGLTRMGGDNGSNVDIPSTFVGYNAGMDLGSQYSFRHKDYIIHIEEQEEIDYRMYLWPFAIVVGVCFLMIMLFLVIKFVRDHTRTRVARLSKKHLKKIPIRKFKKGQYYDTCAICLDEYEDGEKIRVLPCDHAYHTKCIDPWLTRNKKTCPVCKRRVIPGKDPNSDDSGSESEGGTASSATTPLLLNSSQRSHGSLVQNDNDTGRTPRAQSAPATFEAAVILEEEGAVGSVVVSTPTESSSSRATEEADLERGEQREGRKKKKERKEENKDSSVAEDEEEQRKLDRRERRKKKKEKKKREERRSRRNAEEDVERDGETSRLVVEVDVEHGRDSTLSEGAAVAAAAVDDEDDDEQGYINPSFSESQEVVVPMNKGKKRELSEVV